MVFYAMIILWYQIKSKFYYSSDSACDDNKVRISAKEEHAD